MSHNPYYRKHRCGYADEDEHNGHYYKKVSDGGNAFYPHRFGGVKNSKRKTIKRKLRKRKTMRR